MLGHAAFERALRTRRGALAAVALVLAPVGIVALALRVLGLGRRR